MGSFCSHQTPCSNSNRWAACPSGSLNRSKRMSIPSQESIPFAWPAVTHLQAERHPLTSSAPCLLEVASRAVMVPEVIHWAFLRLQKPREISIPTRAKGWLTMWDRCLISKSKSILPIRLTSKIWSLNSSFRLQVPKVLRKLKFKRLSSLLVKAEARLKLIDLGKPILVVGQVTLISTLRISSWILSSVACPRTRSIFTICMREVPWRLEPNRFKSIWMQIGSTGAHPRRWMIPFWIFWLLQIRARGIPQEPNQEGNQSAAFSVKTLLRSLMLPPNLL